jgi:hypothetical protein
MNDQPHPRPEPATPIKHLLEQSQALREQSRSLREESLRLRAHFHKVCERVGRILDRK